MYGLIAVMVRLGCSRQGMGTRRSLGGCWNLSMQPELTAKAKPCSSSGDAAGRTASCGACLLPKQSAFAVGGRPGSLYAPTDKFKPPMPPNRRATLLLPLTAGITFGGEQFPDVLWKWMRTWAILGGRLFTRCDGAQRIAEWLQGMREMRYSHLELVVFSLGCLLCILGLRLVVVSGNYICWPQKEDCMLPLQGTQTHHPVQNNEY
eukprot:366043-Chlamydomonas_euryale.AAC.5